MGVYRRHPVRFVSVGMQRLDVQLLGRFEVRVDSRPVPEDAWPQKRAIDLVKLLALSRGHRMPRDQVLEKLWPRLGADAGAANLHKAASYARRALGERDAVVVRGGVVALAPDADVFTDVERFELPNLHALNFLLHGALDGGGTMSLKTDAQGKVFSTALLRMEIDVPAALGRRWRHANG